MVEFLDGNTAVSRAAIRAGCRFFAGYPITPATSILLQMVRDLPKAGGTALQVEDETAAIGMCLAASMAGTMAMTATSGPGLSLMSENIGLAIMGETPLVIVDCQRMGPATGGATATGEGDVYFVRYGTSGGYPVIALAPTDVLTAYEATFRAFALAEEYRTPVFLMLSKELGQTRRSVDLEAAVEAPVPPRRQAQAEGRTPSTPGSLGMGAEGFQPYRFDKPEEVPAFLPVGGPTRVRFTTSVHDEEGSITRDRVKIARLLAHLQAKVEHAADRIAWVQEDLQAGAQTLVVAYGATAKTAEEAVAAARAAGRKVSLLTLYTLWPVPAARLRRAAEGVRRIVVPELNFGQYALEVERICPGRELVRVNRVDGGLIAPADIAEALA